MNIINKDSSLNQFCLHFSTLSNRLVLHIDSILLITWTASGSSCCSRSRTQCISASSPSPPSWKTLCSTRCSCSLPSGTAFCQAPCWTARPLCKMHSTGTPYLRCIQSALLFRSAQFATFVSPARPLSLRSSAPVCPLPSTGAVMNRSHRFCTCLSGLLRTFLWGFRLTHWRPFLGGFVWFTIFWWFLCRVWLGWGFRRFFRVRLKESWRFVWTFRGWWRINWGFWFCVGDFWGGCLKGCRSWNGPITVFGQLRSFPCKKRRSWWVWRASLRWSDRGAFIFCPWAFTWLGSKVCLSTPYCFWIMCQECWGFWGRSRVQTHWSFLTGCRWHGWFSSRGKRRKTQSSPASHPRPRCPQWYQVHSMSPWTPPETKAAWCTFQWCSILWSLGKVRSRISEPVLCLPSLSSTRPWGSLCPWLPPCWTLWSCLSWSWRGKFAKCRRKWLRCWVCTRKDWVREKVPEAAPEILSFEFLELFVVVESDNKIQETLVNAGLWFFFVLLDQGQDHLLFEEQWLVLFARHDLAQWPNFNIKITCKSIWIWIFQGLVHFLNQVQIILDTETVFQRVLVLRQRVVKKQVKLLAVFPLQRSQQFFQHLILHQKFEHLAVLLAQVSKEKCQVLLALHVWTEVLHVLLPHQFLYVLFEVLFLNGWVFADFACQFDPQVENGGWGEFLGSKDFGELVQQTLLVDFRLELHKLRKQQLRGSLQVLHQLSKVKAHQLRVLLQLPCPLPQVVLYLYEQRISFVSAFLFNGAQPFQSPSLINNYLFRYSKNLFTGFSSLFSNRYSIA